MEYRQIVSISEAKKVFPLLQEMREDLSEEEFLKRLALAQAESGYVFLGAFEGQDCLGLMGYRVLTDFVHGRHLYIDDLVVTSKLRSRGLGSQLLGHAKKVAASLDCQRLRLCTGIQNEKAKGFYEKNGWDLRAVVYKSKI